MANILLAGCGAIATQLGIQLQQQGHSLWGMKRSKTDLPFPLIQADFSKPLPSGLLPPCLDYVVHTATPGERSDHGYKTAYCDGVSNLLAALDSTTIRRFFFVSSTAVYHQNDGSWVDETSPCNPKRFNGTRLLQAEQILQDSAFKGTSLRFAGIYGRGRNYLINRVKSGSEIQLEPPKYTNRIHQDDCVGMLAFLIAQDLSERHLDDCYVGVDDNPASEAEVHQWLAKQLNAPDPAVKKTTKSPQQNKRCSNQRIRSLGYQFNYSGYEQGYAVELSKGE